MGKCKCDSVYVALASSIVLCAFTLTLFTVVGFATKDHGSTTSDSSHDHHLMTMEMIEQREGSGSPVVLPVVTDLLETASQTQGGGGEALKIMDLVNHTEAVCVILLCLVAATLVFEATREALEHFFHKNKLTFQMQVMERTIAELAILGFVSFVLFLIREQLFFSKLIALISGDDYHDVAHILHEIHMLLFIVLVMYIAMVLATTTVAVLSIKSWNKEKGGCCRQFIMFPFKVLWGCPCYRKVMLNVRKTFCLNPSDEYKKFVAEYESKQTISADNIQSDSDDCFIHFLETKTHSTMLHMVEVHWHIWVSLFLTSLTCFFFVLAFPTLSQSENVFMYAFTTTGYVIILALAAVLIRLWVLLTRLGMVGKLKISADEAQLLEESKSKAAVNMSNFLLFSSEIRLLADLTQGCIFGMALYLSICTIIYDVIVSHPAYLVGTCICPIAFMFMLPYLIPYYSLVVAVSGKTGGDHNNEDHDCGKVIEESEDEEVEVVEEESITYNLNH